MAAVLRAQASEELVDVYPWETMMLAFRPLHEMKVYLQSVDDTAELEARYPGVVLIRSFLEDRVLLKIGLSVGALVIDVRGDRAGFKFANDLNGTIQSIPWNSDEILEIVRFCHEFTMQRHRFREQVRGLAKLGIAEGWRQLARSKPPFVDEVAYFSAWERFTADIATRGDELEKLIESDPTLGAKCAELVVRFTERQDRIRSEFLEAEFANLRLTTNAYALGSLDQDVREFAVASIASIADPSTESSEMTFRALAIEVVDSRTAYAETWRELLAPFDLVTDDR